MRPFGNASPNFSSDGHVKHNARSAGRGKVTSSARADPTSPVPADASYMTAKDVNPSLIARRATDFKLLILAQSVTSGWLLQPGAPLAGVVLELTGRASSTPTQGEALIKCTAPDPRNNSQAYLLTEVFTRLAERDGQIRDDVLAGTMNQAIVALSALLPAPDPADPEMQFIRHYRNAIAHGDRWDFKDGQPSSPARFRHLELTQDLHGRRASFDTVAPGLVIQLLDYLVERFDPSQAVPLSDTSHIRPATARRIEILPIHEPIRRVIP